MPLAQRKFREIVFQVLYGEGFSEKRSEESESFFMEEFKITRKSMKKVYEFVDKIVEKKREIEEKIKEKSTEYRLERISLVELNILRLGVYELFYEEKTPPTVVFAEAIRLSRKFGTPQSANFVNAMLDAMFKEKKEICKD